MDSLIENRSARGGSYLSVGLAPIDWNLMGQHINAMADVVFFAVWSSFNRNLKTSLVFARNEALTVGEDFVSGVKNG